MEPSRRNVAVAVFAATVLCSATGAQASQEGLRATTAPPGTSAAAPVGITPPVDYVIGPSDHLSIIFWRETDLSVNVVVRPDGKISLPLLNDVQASGLTPDELRQQLVTAASRYLAEPVATVVVTEISSRKVFITGMVQKPGAYPLTGPTTVLQLIATAGGLLEYANSRRILVVRRENGREVSYRFDYRDVLEQRNTRQNIELKPGDTVVVP